MTRKEAKAELKQILDNQKTVSITRLKRIMETIDYDSMEKNYMNVNSKLKSRQDKFNKMARELDELKRKRTNRMAT